VLGSPDGSSVVGSSDGSSVVGDWDGVVGVCGDLLGVGSSELGSSDGSSDFDGDGLAEMLGWTAAPWSVSRSNLVTLLETPKVYAAQICAG
jgi:hypothetical protein